MPRKSKKSSDDDDSEDDVDYMKAVSDDSDENDDDDDDEDFNDGDEGSKKKRKAPKGKKQPVSQPKKSGASAPKTEAKKAPAKKQSKDPMADNAKKSVAKKAKVSNPTPSKSTSQVPRGPDSSKAKRAIVAVASTKGAVGVDEESNLDPDEKVNVESPINEDDDGESSSETRNGSQAVAKASLTVPTQRGGGVSKATSSAATPRQTPAMKHFSSSPSSSPVKTNSAPPRAGLKASSGLGGPVSSQSLSRPPRVGLSRRGFIPPLHPSSSS
eukprot:TRINITY_DN9213_c0_g1_i2.p1 TRINITY_DN9213_c0_g1~~TRINITY_DN9213_c0_g1_i2.p1  ORF type:complete len:270 (-),score=75.18 TRINITY_DN9213_c0_g1_i2:188-997(-)